MNLKGKQVATFAEDVYEDIELWYPCYRLQEAGATVTMVASSRTEVHMGKHGIPCRPDCKIDEVRAADFNALVIPGGFSPDFMRRKSAMVNFVCEMNSQGKVIGSICHAGWMLASAGIVKGRKITCLSSIKNDLLSAGSNLRAIKP